MSDILPGVLVIAMTGDYRNFKAAATKGVRIARTATNCDRSHHNTEKIIMSGFAGHSRPPSRTEAGPLVEVNHSATGAPALDLPGPKYESSPPIHHVPRSRLKGRAHPDRMCTSAKRDYFNTGHE